jgi:type IV pilus assembly protein PilA
MMFPMPERRLKATARGLRREDGFTLIELLVVLIIIGLLAAIGIAAFTGQQNKAHDVEAKSAAKSAQLAMETYFVEHKSYSGATAGELQILQPALQDAPPLTIDHANADEFELSVVSNATSPVTFTVTRASSGTISRTCSPADEGGCKSGLW